ncbi:MAG: hypothetical protein MUF87_02290 [Anaerolineae bacterium]|jgi:hypothetical protein|nr:hypothetical protein [Anaerolineae bacterium]
MLKQALLIALLALLLAAGCQGGSPAGTDNDSNDAAAVQQFFPQISGYQSASVGDIAQSIAVVAGGASLATGNVLGAASIERLNTLRACLEGVGAVDARVYTQVSLTPVVGMLVLVNRERVAANLLSCTLGRAGPRAQGATDPQPCAGSGSFTAEGNTFDYFYVASDTDLCTKLEAGFASYPRP